MKFKWINVEHPTYLWLQNTSTNKCYKVQSIDSPTSAADRLSNNCLGFSRSFGLRRGVLGHSLSLRGRVWTGLLRWIIRWRLSSISLGYWRRNGLLCWSCGYKLLVSCGRRSHDDCSWMAITIIRATSTAETRHDGNHNGGDHQTADDNAYNDWSLEYRASVAIAIRVTAFVRTALVIESAAAALFSTDIIRTTRLTKTTIGIRWTVRGTCRAKKEGEKHKNFLERHDNAVYFFRVRKMTHNTHREWFIMHSGLSGLAPVQIRSSLQRINYWRGTLRDDIKNGHVER